VDDSDVTLTVAWCTGLEVVMLLDGAWGKSSGGKDVHTRGRIRRHALHDQGTRSRVRAVDLWFDSIDPVC
jgi:hypothetical protein